MYTHGEYKNENSQKNVKGERMKFEKAWYYKHMFGDIIWTRDMPF